MATKKKRITISLSIEAFNNLISICKSERIIVDNKNGSRRCIFNSNPSKSFVINTFLENYVYTKINK